ncbi:methylcrotonoyl-CoA carboxylase subunit alpha, mitochondrial-like, partial [Phalaenopsis equestris]|uniref:methylcrotonoyl-CoA carboxylase subunit alpha, mitochondrial-like n=1 Tax=Phalaenopsis equestris TaxID=78828 RepID=UPI0009E2B3A7
SFCEESGILLLASLSSCLRCSLLPIPLRRVRGLALKTNGVALIRSLPATSSYATWSLSVYPRAQPAGVPLRLEYTQKTFIGASSLQLVHSITTTQSPFLQQVAGLPTNIGFLYKLANHWAFEKGLVETHFIEHFKEDLFIDSGVDIAAGTSASSKLGAAFVAACICENDHNTYKENYPVLVVKVLLDNGAKVDEGQPVPVLGAMKMEHVVKSPRVGYIEGLHIASGQQVFDTSILFTVKLCCSFNYHLYFLTQLQTL